MGLSSWIQKLLARSKAQTRQARSAREDFVQLFLTRLEDRRVLDASFSLVGADSLLLNNFTEITYENLTIQDNGTEYLFMLSEGVWDGTDGGGVTGEGTDTLAVDKALINNTIQIDDSADIDVDISFETVDFSGLTGSLDIIGAGAISQEMGSTVIISTFDVDAVSLTLDEASNDFDTVTINVSAEAILRDANEVTLGAITTGGLFQITTAGVMTLTDDINTNGGHAILDGDVELGADVLISTEDGMTDGDLTVTGTLNADAAANNRSLTVTSGSGSVDLQDNVGETEALASLSINATGGTGSIEVNGIGTATNAGVTDATILGNTNTSALTLTGANYRTVGTQTYRVAVGQEILLSAGTNVSFVTSNNTIDFGTFGDPRVLRLADGSNLSINAGTASVELGGGLRGTSDETVSLTANQIRLGAVGDGGEILSVTTNGNILDLRGDITTSGNAGNFVEINSTFTQLQVGGNDISITALGGAISLQNVQGGGRDLTLNAGTGTVTASGGSGWGTVGNELHNLNVTASEFHVGTNIRTRAREESGTDTPGHVTINADVVNVTANITIDTTADDGLNVADGTLTVNGAINAVGQILTINVGTTDLTLANPAHDFGTLNLTAHNATIVDTDGIQLGTSTLTGNLSVTAGGAITEAATPGMITTNGNLTLTANGNIGAMGSGALDVRVGGTAKLTAIGSDIFLSSDEDLLIDELETEANQADTVQITTTGTANLTLQVLGANFVNLETDNVTLATENGVLTIQGDTLTVGSLALVNTGAAGTMSITSNLATTGGLSVNTAATATITGQISGTGHLTKLGTGLLTLAGTNTYTGTTDILAGALRVDGEIGNGGPAGLVTVQTAATLSGSGTVNADVLGQAGSFITATGNGFTLGNAASATGFATAGTLNVGSFTVTLHDLDAAELGGTTDLDGGTLIAENGVVVGNGGTLQGVGTVSTISGALTVQDGGTLTPGNSPGIINTNNLVLESGATYVVDLNAPYQIAGTDYDQINVTGDVTLNEATLLLQGGSGVPADSTMVMILQNDGTDPIAGTFNGLAQGATVTIGDFTGHINYFGGDGNDITLEVAGAFTFDNTGGGDVTLRQNAANSTIEIVKDGMVVESRLSLAVTEIIINGDPGEDDTLIVDYGFGGFFTQTVTYDGGPGNNDALVVTGGTFGLVEHTFTGPDAGTILYDVDGNLATTSDQATIIYLGLEPVDMTGSTITDLVFNLPVTNDQAILEDDGTAGNDISQIRSQNGTFETTTFANPTGSLTINLGDGDDILTIEDLPDFTASLTVNSGAGSDIVNFEGELNLGSPTHEGNLDVTAEFINFAAVAAVNTTAGTVGDVMLTAAQDITMQEGSTITTNGNATLEAGNNVLLSRVVVGGTNTASITAGNTITDNTAGEGAGNENIVAQNIVLQAVNGIGSGTGVFGEGEDIDIAGVTLTAINTTSGNIQIFAVGDIALNRVENLTRTVVIESSGAITDANPLSEGAGNENIVGGNIVLQAVNGIGSGTGVLGEGVDIDINGMTLTAINTTSGNIQIFAVGDIALNRVENLTRTVVIESSGAITDANPADEGMDNENIVGGDIVLQAVNGIGSGMMGVFGEDEDLDINGATLFANNTGSNNIQIFAVGDIAIVQLINPGRTVILDATGSITDGTPGDDTNANLIAGMAGLRATTGIGAGVAGDLSDIDTTVGTLAAQTVTGNINISDTEALIIGSVGGLVGITITTGGMEDDITVTAAGTLTVTNAVVNGGMGDITLTAENGNDLLINANVLANAPGNITLSGQNVTLNSTGAASPTVEIMGDGTITDTTPRSGPVTGTGIITVIAPGVTTLNANSTIRTGGGVIQITTDDIIINDTALIESSQANGGVVMIRNASAGQNPSERRNIELGGIGDGTVLNITNAELGRIRAASLRIGRWDGVADTGNILITATFSAELPSPPTVQLFAGGNVTQNAGAGFIAGNIGIDVGGSVMLGDAANDAIQTLAILAGESVLFNDANSLAIGRIADRVDAALPADGEAGISGVMSMNSFVDLRAQNGDLTVQAIAETSTEIFAGGVNTANNLAINLLAAGPNTFININAGANVFSDQGAHRYTADNMDIDGTITATGQTVNLRNANANAAIDLGSLTDNPNATLELSNAELNNITAGLLAIGRNTGNVSGNITVTNTINLNTTDTLHLITPGTVTDAANGAIVVPNLLIEAAGGATLDNIAMNDVDTLAALITDPGASFTFMDRDNLVVGTVNRLTVDNLPNEAVGLTTFSGIITNGGNVTIISADRDPMADPPLVGVGVLVSDPIITTAEGGGLNSGSITIMAMGTGGIDINAPLITTGTTIGGNGEGGDITLTTDDSDININTGDLNALGGNGAVDGGNITLDADGTNSDVTINGVLMTNDIAGGIVRGNIVINADDAVFINGTLSTTGQGTVTITANTNAAAGDDGGMLTMAEGTAINAENGNVTLRTLAGDVGTILVENITTSGGSVLIDANGINANVVLQSAIVTGNGNVTVQADDSVIFLTTASIVSSGAGNVLVRADDDDDAGDDDQIVMNDDGAANAFIRTNTGTIELRNDGTNGNGGDITITQLVTSNTTLNAITIISNGSVLDGGDSNTAGTMLGKDIEAVADANSRVNIVANTGIGIGNALETAARRFDVQNTGAADIHIDNMTDGLDVTIERMATVGGDINFTNTSGTGLLTIANSGVSSGDALANVDGGDITITTDGNLLLNALLSSRDGSGGTFTLNGGAIFGAGSAITLGAGDITLTTGGQDIMIDTTLVITNGPVLLTAPRDIIVNALLLSLVDDGTGTGNFVNATDTLVQNGSPIDSHITLQADNDNDGVGGVLVRGSGQVVASGDLTIVGSDLSTDNDMLVPNILGTDIRNGVHIEADPADQPQLLAAGNLTLQNTLGIAGADIVLGGILGTQSPTPGTSLNVLIDANDNIHLADNTRIFTPANVTFGDVMGRDPVIDDGVMGTPSNLTVDAGGIITFFGRVEIDSLTTGTTGATHIRGGFVTTAGNQTFGNNVLINADTFLANATTFTAGGKVNFLGNVFGLDLGPDNVGGVILDDLVLNVACTTTFAGQVGINSPTGRIGDGIGHAIIINSSGQTFFNNQVFTQSGILQNELAGRVTFRADVSIDTGDSESFFLANVTLDSMTMLSNGNLTFGTPNAPNADQLLIFLGSRIDTGMQSRNITINSRVTDPLPTNEDLRLNLNMGNLTINGSVGNPNTDNRFGNLIIETANNFLLAPEGSQILFGESLTQLDGVDAPGNPAHTVLNGTINTSSAEGVTLATTHVVYNANIVTNGGRVLTQASGNIVQAFNGSITTMGGLVVFDAVGSIDMQEGPQGTATINASHSNPALAGGSVVLQAGSNLAVSQILSAGGFVNLTSTNGAVIDAGNEFALGSMHDVQAAHLRIEAANGIGGAGNSVLNTLVSHLEARNTSTGGIFVMNAGDLTIGGVPAMTVQTLRNGSSKEIPLSPIGGVLNNNGQIGLTTTGNWVALPNTVIQAINGTVGIGVEGNALFQGHVASLNGNNNILVNVGGNFTLMNGFAEADLLVNGSGEIVVEAVGTVTFIGTSDLLVQSGTGAIRQTTPMVTNISTPQVRTDGLAELTFSLGLPGERNFAALVDWGDGTVTVLTGLNGAQTYTIGHRYGGNPDPNNPGADIRVLLVVVTDPNIHFFGSNTLNLTIPNPLLPVNSTPPPGSLIGPATLAPPNGTIRVDFRGTLNDFVQAARRPQEQLTVNDLVNSAISLNDLGIFTAIPAFRVPFGPFGGAVMEARRELPPFFVPGASVDAIPEDSSDLSDDSDDLDFSGSGSEEKGEGEVKVRLRVLSPAGQMLFEYDIDPKYLSNPAPLWLMLVDGRYQIVIEEPGSSVPIVVRDVELKDHKVIRRFDPAPRGPQRETSQRENPPDDVPVSWLVPDVSRPETEKKPLASEPQAEVSSAAASDPDHVWENWQGPHSAKRLSRLTPEPQDETGETPSATAAFTAGLALAAMRTRSSKDSDSQLTGFSKRSLSPAARLRRRLQKP